MTMEVKDNYILFQMKLNIAERFLWSQPLQTKYINWWFG